MNLFLTSAICLAAAATSPWQGEVAVGQERVQLRMNLVAPPGAGAG